MSLRRENACFSLNGLKGGVIKKEKSFSYFKNHQERSKNEKNTILPNDVQNLFLKACKNEMALKKTTTQIVIKKRENAEMNADG